LIEGRNVWWVRTNTRQNTAHVSCLRGHEQLLSTPTYTRAPEYTPGAHNTPKSIARNWNWKLRVTTANNRQLGVSSWILGMFKCLVLTPECILKKYNRATTRRPALPGLWATPKTRRPPYPFFRAVSKTRRPPYPVSRVVPKTRRPPYQGFQAGVSKRPGGRPPGPVGGPDHHPPLCPCTAASFEINSEPHTGARPSVRLCVGPELARCVHLTRIKIIQMYKP
jgi:hypothetical protein